MRRYKKNRAKRRTPYETYKYWYEQKTKTEAGKRKYLPMMPEEEFNKIYADAKKIYKNPAKTIAEKQRKIQFSFQKRYEEETGFKLKIEDFETAEARQQIFRRFAEEYADWDTAREEFEALY